MNRRDALRRSGLLVGVSISAGALTSLMQSCTQADRLSWEPQYLTTDQAQLVASIVDHLLPKTDSPGGLEIGVDLFVDRMLATSLPTEDQKHVRRGLEAFEKRCRAQHAKPFHRLESSEQLRLLKTLGEETNTFNVAVWGSPIGEQAPLDFYRRVRQFALLGYFTSAEVGRDVLGYDPVPGEYQGCIPLQEGQKAWSL